MLREYYIISQTALVVALMGCAITTWTMRGGSRARGLLAVVFSVLFCGMATVSVFDLLRPDIRPEKLNFAYILACIAEAGLIYLYFRLLMEPWRSWRRFTARLGGGLACAAVVYAACVVLCSDAPALYSMDDIVAGAAHPVVALRIAAFVSFIAALILGGVGAWKMWQRHKKAIADRFSFREGISLSWIPAMMILYALLGAWTIYDLLISGDVGWDIIASNLFYMAFYMVVNQIGLHQQDIYTKMEIEAETDSAARQGPSPVDAGTLSVSADVREKLKADLLRLMEDGHGYRDPDLRREGVVRTLNTNRKYLSAVLRDDFNTTFIGFVNGYRIGEAKYLLKQHSPALSIPEVAERVGFKSISSFYDFFRRTVGQSPAEFRERNGHGYDLEQ